MELVGGGLRLLLSSAYVLGLGTRLKPVNMASDLRKRSWRSLEDTAPFSYKGAVGLWVKVLVRGTIRVPA
jgi:hypothetical protein